MPPALSPIAAAIIAAIGMARAGTAGAEAPRGAIPARPSPAMGGRS